MLAGLTASLRSISAPPLLPISPPFCFLCLLATPPKFLHCFLLQLLTRKSDFYNLVAVNDITEGHGACGDRSFPDKTTSYFLCKGMHCQSSEERRGNRQIWGAKILLISKYILGYSTSLAIKIERKPRLHFLTIKLAKEFFINDTKCCTFERAISHKNVHIVDPGISLLK